MEREDSIFNPEHRKEKKFLRKETKTTILRIIIISVVVLFLGSKYFESKVIGLGIYTIKWEQIDSCYVNGTANFYLQNNSPYKLKLYFSSDYSFNTSYNIEDILYPDVSTFIWFKSDVGQIIKVTGERV